MALPSLLHERVSSGKEFERMAVESKNSRGTAQRALTQEADELYEKFALPLEAEHEGEFVAISKQGQVVRAPTLQQVLDLSLRVLGKGSFVFRLGANRAVVKFKETDLYCSHREKQTPTHKSRIAHTSQARALLLPGRKPSC